MNYKFYKVSTLTASYSENGYRYDANPSPELQNQVESLISKFNSEYKDMPFTIEEMPSLFESFKKCWRSLPEFPNAFYQGEDFEVNIDCWNDVKVKIAFQVYFDSEESENTFIFLMQFISDTEEEIDKVKEAFANANID